MTELSKNVILHEINTIFFGLGEISDGCNNRIEVSCHIFSIFIVHFRVFSHTFSYVALRRWHELISKGVLEIHFHRIQVLHHLCTVNEYDIAPTNRSGSIFR